MPRPALYGRILFTHILEGRVVLDCILSLVPNEPGVPVALSLRTQGCVRPDIAEYLEYWAAHDQWVRIDVANEGADAAVSITGGRSRVLLGMDYGGAGLGV